MSSSPQRTNPATGGNRRGAPNPSTIQHVNNTETPIQKLQNRLENWRAAGRDQYMASAPTREDRTPSLAIRELPDGRVLMHDFGGDESGEILAAIGLSLSDLFPDHGRDEARRIPPGQRWDYRGLLKLLRHEATVVQLCAADMARGEALSPDDYERLRKASLRIHKVAEVA